MARLNWTLTAALGLMLLQGCDNQTTQAASPIVDRPVKVAAIEAVNSAGTKRFTATVEPTYDANLAFRVNGELVKINVVAGQYVKQGDVLALLDDQDFVLQVKQAQARYDLAKSQFSRAKQLYSEQLISQSNFDEAKAQLDIAEAQLDAAQTNLKYTKLIAPFDGIIAQHYVENFEFVQAKQPIVELQSRDTVDVAIQVPEELMARLPKSAAVNAYQPTLVLDANPDVTYKVTLREHDVAPNPATKSYKVVFSLPLPSDINVLSGMTGSLYVELDQVFGVVSEQYRVPNEAVFQPNQFAGQDRHFIYLLNAEQILQLVEVTLVKLDEDGAIIKPLQSMNLAAYKVVAAGSHLLQNGQKVIIWQREKGL